MAATGWARDWAQYNQPLPPGWEAKYDAGSGRYFFINHMTHTTTWVDPRLSVQPQQPQQPWQQPMQQPRQQPRQQPKPEHIPMSSFQSSQPSPAGRAETPAEPEETSFGGDIGKESDDDSFTGLFDADDDLDIFGGSKSLEEQERIKEKLKKEFPGADDFDIDMALESNSYDENRAREEIKKQMDEGAARSQSRAGNSGASSASKKTTPASEPPKTTPKPASKPSTKPKTSAEKSKTPKASTQPKTTAVKSTTSKASTQPKTTAVKSTTSDSSKPKPKQTDTQKNEETEPSHDDTLKDLLSGSTYSSSMSKLSESHTQGTASLLDHDDSLSAQAFISNKSETVETRQVRMANKGGFSSHLREPPQGPQPSLKKGSDKSLLLKHYQETFGSNKMYVCGPQPSNVCGPVGKEKNRPKLACGTQHSLAKGAQPDFVKGPMYSVIGSAV